MRQAPEVIARTKGIRGSALLGAAATSSVLFHSKVKERERLLRHLIARATKGGTIRDADEIAIRLARAIYERTWGTVSLEHLSPFERLETRSWFNMTAAVSLKYGAYGVSGVPNGPCGTMSRTLLNALWLVGIPARKLQLLPTGEGVPGHTVVEYFSNGRWQVISPSDGGFVWRTADGRIATLEEIRSDPDVFEQIHEVDHGWPFRFDNVRRIRWDKLPRPVRNAVERLLGPDSNTWRRRGSSINRGRSGSRAATCPA
jgi:hypothetical protein